jgi:hypothetical protein
MADGDLNFGDMEETMSDAFDKIEADESGEESADDTQQEESDDTGNEGDDGESSSDEEQGSEEATGESEYSEEGQGTEGEDDTSEEKSVEPPTSWSDEDKEEFLKLPPEVREIIARREGERESAFHDKSQGFADSQAKINALESIVAPRRQGWAANGMNETQAIQQLIALSDMANSRPGEFIQWLAKTTNFDLGTLVEDYGGGDEYADELDGEDSALLQRVSQLENHIVQNANAENVRAQGEAAFTLESFSNDKDNTGQIKHPHYEKVKTAMGNLIEAGQANSLDEAYGKAIWMDPEIRDTLIEKSNKSALKGGKKKVSTDRAKRAAGSNKKSSSASGVGKDAPAKSFEETMSKTYDEINA